MAYERKAEGGTGNRAAHYDEVRVRAAASEPRHTGLLRAIVGAAQTRGAWVRTQEPAL